MREKSNLHQACFREPPTVRRRYMAEDEWAPEGVPKATASRQRRQRFRYQGDAYHGYANERASRQRGKAEWHHGSSASAHVKCVEAFLLWITASAGHDPSGSTADDAPYDPWIFKRFLKGRYLK